MSGSEYTADQIAAAIETALRDREVQVVPSLLKMLAVRDPQRAQAMLDTITMGIDLNRRLRHTADEAGETS